jgi:WD40 repeat protein
MQHLQTTQIQRYEDDDDRPVAGSGAFKIPDRDFYRKNFCSFFSISNITKINHDRLLQPHFSSLAAITTPYGNRNNPADGVCCHFLRRGFTKPTKVPFNCAVWSADSRWLVLGTQTGDLALWEEEGLKVYKIVSVPAHKEFYGDGDRIKEQIPITSMASKSYGNLLATGDNRGLIQYCDETFRNVYVTKDAHSQAVRGLSFAPMDTKLASCRYSVHCALARAIDT